jgi:hypothetical protein
MLVVLVRLGVAVVAASTRSHQVAWTLVSAVEVVTTRRRSDVEARTSI